MPAPPDIDSLWDYRDPERSETSFRDLLESLSPDVAPAYRAELLTQLGRARALQRRFADALRTLDEAEAVPGGATARVLARARLERGRILRDLGENDRALALFTGVLELARSAGEEAVALDAAHMLGYASAPAEAVRWNREAIGIALASADPALRRWLGSLHMNLAAGLIELGRHDEARDAFADAERFRREAGDERGARDARAGIAKALRLEGRVEEALAVARGLLDEPEIDPEWNGDAHEEAAEALLALGRDDEARDQFALAWPILAADPWFPPDQTERLDRIRRLGGQ